MTSPRTRSALVMTQGKMGAMARPNTAVAIHGACAKRKAAAESAAAAVQPASMAAGERRVETGMASNRPTERGVGWWHTQVIQVGRRVVGGRLQWCGGTRDGVGLTQVGDVDGWVSGGWADMTMRRTRIALVT